MNDTNTLNLPVLALRGLVCIPGTMLHFEVGRKKSVAAVNEAMKSDRLIFAVCQKGLDSDNIEPDNLFEYGTIAKIKQVLKVSDGAIKVLIEGVTRARITSIVKTEPYIYAELLKVNSYEIEDKLKNEALIRSVQETFDEYCSFIGKLPPEITNGIYIAYCAGQLTDFITANIPLKYESKQLILETEDAAERAEVLICVLCAEIQILSAQQNIHYKVQEAMQKNQRDYYLREQIKVIEEELGEDDIHDEVDEYRYKICSLHLDKKTEEKLLSEVARFEKIPMNSPESTVVRTYLDTCLSLPWKKESKERIDIAAAAKILEQDHYGLKKVKERILEYLAVRTLSTDIKGQIICLLGPPGVGKTSIAASIAKAMNRKYVRASLGGVRDEAEIRGHRKTYIGSMPGRIINSVITAGTKNPLVLLDEIDKLSNDFRGDPSSALLEVLDPEQNKSFRDHYIELPFDLSDVLFITTANTLDSIPRPLLDRMDVIELNTYTDEEKLQIARRHLIPKQAKKHGISRTKFKISDDAVKCIINSYTRESGVRSLERRIADMCRKLAVNIVQNDLRKKVINPADIEAYLGPEKYKDDELGKIPQIGIANGLAYTAVGGEMLNVEVNIMDGTGKIELTGSLGDVMKESCKAAVSYIRSIAPGLDIDTDFYKTKDIHIHVPEGATPKDGPSAGITIATAIISELTKRPVRCDIAMTGEITLRGRVLPIGGLKEKTMAAYKNGMKKILIPHGNITDIIDIEAVVKGSCEIIPVANMTEVMDITLMEREIKDEQFEMPSAVPVQYLNTSKHLPQ